VGLKLGMKKIIPSLIGGLILWSIIHLIINFTEKKQANKSKDITLEMCMKSNTLDLSKNTTLSEICKKMFTDIRKKAEEINK